MASREFYSGMLCALAVIHNAGFDSLHDEVVGTADRRQLWRVAQHDGALVWSGMSAWRKRNAQKLAAEGFDPRTRARASKRGAS